MATNVKFAAMVLVAGLLVGAGAMAVLGGQSGGPATPGADDATVADGMTTFESSEEYSEYVESGSAVYYGGGVGGAGGVATADVTADRARLESAGGADGEAAAPTSTDGAQSVRVGGTNVQERGIDEPDLVAAVGSHFFYSPTGPVRYVPVREGGRSQESPEQPDRRTHVIYAGEPADPALVAEINATGQLVRSGDSLVVLGHRQVTGYDVSDPGDPTKLWSRALNSSIDTARVADGRLYLVTRTSAHKPCPVEPLEGATIACTGIYHPRVQVNVDATYTAFSIDPGDGSVVDSTSFVGTARSTVVYMSNQSLYVTYTKETSRTELVTDYLLEEAEGVPGDVRDRLAEIDGYDISATSKQREMQRAIQNWLSSLPADQRQRAQERLSSGIRSYVSDHQREFTQTGIVRIGVGDGDLAVDATGTVPGRPLNQFSMDEREGTLRIATTIPAMYGAQSENDLYTLEADSLDRIGAATGMGVDERIYSVRYVGDTAYMVTFRQIDPFHVVDLSNPADPRELGNVELPGFSDYLHPVGEDAIMGIGQEDGQVKAVLFDVSDPSNPTVADSQILDAGWSAVSGTHHAFMQDARHDIAFIPAGDQGIVLNYANDTLAVEKKLRLEAAPERARYVGDYLYVFSPAEVAVFDETTWQRAANVSLAD